VLVCSGIQLLETKDRGECGSGKIFSATLNRQSNILKKFSIIITTGQCVRNVAKDRREQQLTSMFPLENFCSRRVGDSDHELIADWI
jgi:hypothetical protein